MSEPQQYRMRGNRVYPMASNQIEHRAIGFCAALNINKRIKRFDSFFESLVLYNITLSVVDDEQWATDTHNLTSGHFDPDTMTISVPRRVYELACCRDQSALSVMFHELGHLLLGHKPMLHFSNKPPEQDEDSEWQADQFAEYVLLQLGFNVQQLSFDFYQ
ncbi:ImmA/IrrE family metallo-endopeptidase [Aeromonas jandaei]|uniref:ImmA/IrrE family metallo-endopeptidase n=1 Tax=Aeromonas jandaei TaxID=650 RepID=UPI003987BAA3